MLFAARWTRLPWRAIAARWHWALAATLGILAIVAMVKLRAFPYAATVVWSPLLVASFVGWGGLVNRVIAPDRRFDWGLRAGLGMTAFMLTGGYLCILHAAYRGTIVAQVAIGDAALLWSFARGRGPRWSARRLTLWSANAGVLALLAIAYAATVLIFFAMFGDQSYNLSDDQPVYFVYPLRLLATSSLYDPFCARRMAILGGQVYLHAAFLAFAPVSYLNVFDTGIMPTIVVALLAGPVRGGRKAQYGAALGLAALFYFSLQSVRANTTSMMTSVVVLLTIHRMLRQPLDRAVSTPWPLEPRRIAVLATLVVTAVLLRMTAIAAVLPYVVLAVTSDFVFGAPRSIWNRASLKSLAWRAGVFVAALVVALLPWSIMMHASVGTYFYPFGSTFATPGWLVLVPAKSWDEGLKHGLDLLFWDKPVTLLLPFLFAGLVPLAGRARNDVVALTLATLVGIAMLAVTTAGYNEQTSSRYSYGYVVTMAIIVCASVRRADARAALVAVGLALQIQSARETLRRTLVDNVPLAKSAYEARARTSVDFASRTGDYLDVQLRVPAGATIATAVHDGWMFDFARNRIFLLDNLGGMGPKPGWPAFAGPQALGDYLLASGIRYLIWVDWDLPSQMYNRDHFREFLTKEWENSYLHTEARFQLDAQDAIEKLTAMRHVIYKEHGMTLVDLGAPR